MAVAVVEKTSGDAANAEAVTVTFSDAVTGDLIVFVYGTDFKEFGNGDWLPNSGWLAIPSAISDISGMCGMCFHIVTTGQTSWNPVNDDSNSVAGAWIAYRIQGHSTANPVLNYYINESATIFPNTVPGANSVLGMMFTSGMLNSGASTAISGGVGSTPWHIDTQNDSLGNPCVAAYVPAIDNITPAIGTWAGHTGGTAYRLQEWVVQAAPGSPTDASTYILKEEVVVSDLGTFTEPNVGFNISWTPTEGNYLLAIFCASEFFPVEPYDVTANWTLLNTPIPGFFAALRTVQAGDGTAYTVSTTMGTVRADYYVYVYEITGTTYSGMADGAVSAPYYTTHFEGGTGQTLCFFPITVGTDEGNCWPQYAVISSQTSDGSGTSSVNYGGVDSKFVSVSSHQVTMGGGSGSTELSATANSGYGGTIVFEITSGPVGACDLGSDSLNFRGNVSGLFYVKTDLGSEVVPTLYVDSTLSIDNGTMSPSGQAIAQDGQWIDWLPDNGPLSITFPATTIWVVTSQAKGSPPSIPVYATSKTYPPWKQTCTE